MNIKSVCCAVFAIVLAAFSGASVFASNSKTGQNSETNPNQSQKTNQKSESVVFVEKLQNSLEKNSVEETILLFDSIPASLKNSNDMKLLKASLLVSVGRLDEATEITDEILKNEPNSRDAMEIVAQIALAGGNSSAQNAAIKKILASDPNNATANIILGDREQIKKKYKNALNYYRKALLGEPNNRDALFGFAKMSWYTDDLKTAKTFFQKMNELYPEDSESFAYLAKLYAEEENYKSAIEYVNQAIKLSPSNYDYYLDLGTYSRSAGKYSDAEKAWTKAIELDSSYFLAFAYRAGLYDEQNRIKEALSDYHQVVKTNPDYYFAYEEIGILEFHEKKWSAAREYFIKANEHFTKANEFLIKTNPSENQISYHLMIIATYLMEKNSFEAKKYADAAMKPIQDRNSLAYKMLRLYKDQGPINAENAIAMALEKETDKNKRGKMMYYFGLYYDMKGSAKVAKEYYSKVTNMQTPMFFEYRLAEWGFEAF